MASQTSLWQRWKPWALSALAGAMYGILIRLTFNSKWANSSDFPLVMTLGFLAVVPLCMGYIAVDNYFAKTPIENVRGFKWFFLPWISVLIAMAFSLIFALEGAICLIFAAPIMLLFSLVGGLVAKGTWKSSKQRAPGTLSAVALPLLVILVEAHISPTFEIRAVETGILIHAPASAVWNNIKSVPEISPRELPGAWVTRIGFPEPVAAKLSHEGIGGVRQASFTGGLVFTEVVDRWEPGYDLRFSIHANTDAIAPSVLDEHVTVGGAFFDVLDGEYRLEQRSDGVLLRLTSHERLSTHFNPYAGIWTDAVMRSIQNQILQVIRTRCEGGTHQII